MNVQTDNPTVEQPVTSFSELGATRGVRPVMRSAALSALSMMWQRSGRIDNALRTNRVHVLNLHHVFANEEESFRRLLRRLRPAHSFISYSEAVQRMLSGEINRPYMTFTFDDGLKSCVRAVRVLREFSAKACFFICPPIIAETKPEAIERFCHDGMREPVHEFMDWDDIGKLLGEGHEVGSHTMTHPNMALLNSAELQDELCRSAEALRSHTGAAHHFAWPFGRFEEFSAEAARAVFESGYQSCASGVRGCHRSRQAIKRRQLCVRREHIVAQWPLSHALYFIARSARSLIDPQSYWPAGWSDAIEGQSAAHAPG
jgi:peptidoglycan/xylan/chitin deacetylase (PgdA/CDA1 family)